MTNQGLLHTRIADLCVNSDSEIVSISRVCAPVVCARTSSMEKGGVLSNPALGSISEVMVDGGGRQSNQEVGGSTFVQMMELAGLEPATSCMPCRRSPS